MMTVTDAPRAHSPDIELGTFTSHLGAPSFVILRQAVILCQLTCTVHSLFPAYSKRRVRLYRYQSTTPRSRSEQGSGLLLAKLLLRRRSPPCQAPIATTPLASPISSHTHSRARKGCFHRCCTHKCRRGELWRSFGQAVLGLPRASGQI